MRPPAASGKAPAPLGEPMGCRTPPRPGPPRWRHATGSGPPGLAAFIIFLVRDPGPGGLGAEPPTRSDRREPIRNHAHSTGVFSGARNAQPANGTAPARRNPGRCRNSIGSATALISALANPPGWPELNVPTRLCGSKTSSRRVNNVAPGCATKAFGAPGGLGGQRGVGAARKACGPILKAGAVLSRPSQRQVLTRCKPMARARSAPRIHSPAPTATATAARRPETLPITVARKSIWLAK